MNTHGALSSQPRRRVLLVSHVSIFGGAERGLLDIVSALHGTAYNPIVALPKGGLLADHLARRDVPIRFIPLRRLTRTRALSGLIHHTASVLRGAAMLARLIRRERITLVHANSDTAHLYAGLAAALTRVPTIWHGRDMTDMAHLFPWLEATATRMIAVSQAKADHWVNAAARSAKRQQRLGKKMILLPNGVDMREFQPRTLGRQTRQTWHIEASAFVVGMVAHMVPWKNHALFLDAAQRITRACPRSVFLVVGDDLSGAAADYKASLVQRCKQLGLQDRVRFTGFQSDMPALYEAMDVLVHPALNEPFGRGVAEAMAMGIAVVALNQGGPRDLIDHGRSGLLTDPDPEAIAALVLTLADRPDLRQKLGQEAVRRMHRNFTLDIHRARLLDIYHSL